MKEYSKILWQYLLPQHLLSRLVGKIANCRWSFVKGPLIKWCIQHYKIDMADAQPAVYQHFNEFFTRALKPQARPIIAGADTIACPADGYVSHAGTIQDHQLFQAKGFNFDLVRLLGGSSERAAPFRNGQFITLYLSPKDYHRVHMPLTGRLKEMTYVPGRLFSVNPSAVNNIAGLFARNERVVSIFETPQGPMAVILVGAMLVASIETVWMGLVAPRRERTIQTWDYGQHMIRLIKGDEIGRFQFGSTVIVLFANGKMNWNPLLQPDCPVKMGQLLGQLNSV